MHTRTNLESFKSDSFAIKADLDKSVILKKLIRNKHKKRVSHKHHNPFSGIEYMNNTIAN